MEDVGEDREAEGNTSGGRWGVGRGGDHDYTQSPPRGTQEEAVPADNLPSLEEVYGTHVPTFTYIPRLCKATFAKELTRLNNLVVREPTETNYKLLGMFCKVCLPAVRSQRDDSKAAAKVTQSKLDRWGKGRYMELWEETMVLMEKHSPQGRKKGRRKPRKEDVRTQSDFNADRAKKMVQVGQLARGMQALGSLGMAEHTEETVEELKAKHPQGHTQHIPHEVGDSTITFTGEHTGKALQRFKRGSAPGLDGMRAEHLLQTVGNLKKRRESACLQSITALANTMMQGNIPDSIKPYMFGGRLHAALKKDGSIRPISVGNLMRRLVSKMAATAVFDKAQEQLAPLQVGVGTRGGAEAVIHSIKRARRFNPGLNILQVDLVNAFGNAEHGKALDQVAETFPEIYKWCLASYGGTWS